MFRSIFTGLFFISLASAAWGFLVEPDLLVTEPYSLSLSRWPTSCEGMRIAVIADLHAGAPWIDAKKVSKVVEQTQKLEPDLIVIPGDVISKTTPQLPPKEISPMLAQLDAPMGVYAVLGNHDRWIGADLMSWSLRKAGITVLEDRNQLIRQGSCSFHLAGISDYKTGPHDVEKALKGIHDNLPVIAITHHPDIFPLLPATVDLTIAAHTHGGQVYIPGLGHPKVPSHYGQKYALGVVQEAQKSIFVSPGIGTSIIPIRFLVPPEISILTVHTAASQITS